MTTFAEARDFVLRHREDYAHASAHFRWPDEADFNFALDWFDGYARANPGAVALRIVGEGAATRTYAELSAASDRLANGMRAMGVGRGDRVLLMLGNVVALWEAMLAAMKLGAVVIPATTLLTAADVAERVARARVRHVIVGAEDTAKFEGVGAAVTRIAVGGAPGWADFGAIGADGPFVPDGPTRADDPLLLYFTSGTTARPKLVLHSHRSYPAGHLSTLYWLGLLPGDVHLNVSSPGWAKHAWSCVFAPWIAGATVFIANTGRFHAKTLLDTLVEEGVTTLCAPPTVWRMLIQQDLAAWRTNLREVCAAGEPLNPEIIDRVRAAWGLTVRDGYGQTETTAQIGNPPGQPVRPGSMGRALPGYAITLLDLDGAAAEEGAVCLPLDPKPAPLMLGYQEDDGTVRPIDGDVYRTGDVAARDETGYLTYIGRADDIFKASDYRISPFEIESVLIEHPAVAESAVVPSPDPVRMAVPKAFVTLAEGVPATRETAASIYAHLRARLPAYQRVRLLEFGELPKTISGKIRRVELRRLEEARAAGIASPAEEEWREAEFPAPP